MKASPLASFHRGNLLTYASLLAGVAAVAAAANGGSSGAGALVAVSVIFDTFDGKFARLFVRTPAERAFGGQIDSLSDAIAFGIVPAVCVGLLVPRSSIALEIAWWTGAFIFAACAITRLAFYNLTHGDANFIGLPAPVAALIWASLLIWRPGAPLSIIVFVLLGAAMVAPATVPRPAGWGLAAFVAWPIAVVTAHLAGS
jgi:phosphatidylserine synthase